MRAKVYFEPQKVPSMALHYEGWVMCDECPDDFYGPGHFHIEGEAYVCGSCWDAGLEEKNCPHLTWLEMDDDHQLWIECDSEGWDV